MCQKYILIFRFVQKRACRPAGAVCADNGADCSDCCSGKYTGGKLVKTKTGVQVQNKCAPNHKPGVSCWIFKVYIFQREEPSSMIVCYINKSYIYIWHKSHFYTFQGAVQEKKRHLKAIFLCCTFIRLEIKLENSKKVQAKVIVIHRKAELKPF